ncbi:hypothetical protein ACFQ2M_13010 [Kitasatospora saccharophila]|uniref:hypothetical protein n=1 Tax=Kitasatospora saccharophila TaxID=407973 RepID=UPI0036268D2A
MALAVTERRQQRERETVRAAPAKDRYRWWGPLAVAVFAGVLRLWNLGYPHAFVFDETYYPKDAWALWHTGYETAWPDNANQLILGDPQVIPTGKAAAFIAHPRSASGSSAWAPTSGACTPSAGGSPSPCSARSAC